RRVTKALTAIRDETLLTTPMRTLTDYDRATRRARIVVTTAEDERPGEAFVVGPEAADAVAWTFEDGVARYPGIYRTRGGPRISAFAPVLDARGRTAAVLEVDYPVDFYFDRLRELDTTIALGSLAGVVLALILAVVFARRLTRPIVALTGAAGRVAGGDLSQALAVTSRDEVGQLTRAFNAMVEGLRQREVIRNAFGRYVSPEVARAVLESPGGLALGGRKREITVLMSDLRGYTRFAEHGDPAGVMEVLNDYLGRMADVVIAHGGTINEFIGDAIFPVYGASPGPALRAARARRARGPASRSRRRARTRRLAAARRLGRRRQAGAQRVVRRPRAAPRAALHRRRGPGAADPADQRAAAAHVAGPRSRLGRRVGQGHERDGRARADPSHLGRSRRRRRAREPGHRVVGGVVSTRPTRILILGGGFGGVYTALTLEKLLKAEIRRGDVELGLVSRENYIVFQPMLPEVISGSIGLLDTITPIRRLCPNTNLYTRTVESIDLEHRGVMSTAGFGSRQHHLHYDHLVLALGNVTSFAGQPGLAEYALPFKYLGDALTLRNRLIHTLEEADIEQDPDLRRALLTFVVAGGGFSGVEAVAELNDFVRAAARGFRNLRPEEIRVVLLHAGRLILPELPASLAEFAQRLLARRGVEIRLET